MKPLSLFYSVLFGFLLISCSTYEPFTPPANFDERTYINPEKHGGKLTFSINPAEPNSTNESFTPITIKGGFRNAIQSVGRQSRYSDGGGATIEIYVDTTGTLTQIKRIKTTNSSVARALIEVARKSDFSPAMLDGEPVNSYRRMEVYMATTVRTVRRNY